MKLLFLLLIVLHLLVGIAALGGGGAAILNPAAPLGAPLDLLEGTPFTDYLIPGIILFAAVGLLQLAAALTVGLGSRYRPYLSGLAGVVLVGWIAVQSLLTGLFSGLHGAMLAVGLIEMVLALWILRRQGAALTAGKAA